MPAELTRLHGILVRGLTATASHWPPIQRAFGWVHQAAHLLGAEGITAAQVRRCLAGLLGAMTKHRHTVGPLATAVEHFVKVSRSYWPGLFHCYDVADVPRTNNALEQYFGSYRYHERRATGRKTPSPALVLRGAARLLAAAATRQRSYSAAELSTADRQRWLHLRQTLLQRRQLRTHRRRFRQNPQAYLAALEDKLHQSGLPT
jgi:hypothetical protein